MHITSYYLIGINFKDVSRRYFRSTFLQECSQQNAYIFYLMQWHDHVAIELRRSGRVDYKKNDLTNEIFNKQCGDIKYVTDLYNCILPSETLKGRNKTTLKC